ncbi:hypothetical protein PILCRDRAFT_13081 [Piloderma croceum F 1598]|uniref:Heme haloperoxidase family profile domain-containing protein n=1 Tax=Piloderma croceum (strain F 1598) TaxID=765440 RepID=A0A0C3F824_PILCF|nr:hypothetical protein PILCRDRAFT_13081 [Piloderma croceum F 1598]
MVVVVGALAIVNQQSELVVVDEKTRWVGARTWQLVEDINGYFEGFQDNLYSLDIRRSAFGPATGKGEMAFGPSGFACGRALVSFLSQGTVLVSWTTERTTKDVFDLRDIGVHNKIEHDASLIREDIYFEPNTAKIAIPLIEQLLESASDKDADNKHVLTYLDLSNALNQRQADSKASNPGFSRSLLLSMFGFGNCAAMQLVFGGKVEELPLFFSKKGVWMDGVPRNAKCFGITLGEFNVASSKIAFRTKTVPPTITVVSPQLANDDPK